MTTIKTEAIGEFRRATAGRRPREFREDGFE
jgi:hypothetical protein